MSLIEESPEQAAGQAARGEEYAKGTSRLFWAALAAAVLVCMAIAVYVLVGTKPPVAAGEIVQVWVHPRRVETSGVDANGESMAKQNFDEVVVFAHVRLKNQIKDPLVLDNVLANVKQQDGILSVAAGNTAQYDQIFVAYPELGTLRSNAFPPQSTINPGESVDGNLFWIFRMSEREWEARKGLDLSFVFEYQGSLVVAPHGAITAVPE